jgi:hypothetical protein
MNIAVPPIGAICFFRSPNQVRRRVAPARPKRPVAVISADWHSPV